MPKQPAFPVLRDAMKQKVTRREQFLAEMDAVVAWVRLLALIEPQYPKAGQRGGSEGRASAAAAGHDAAAVFPAELGCAPLTDGRGFKRTASDPGDRL